MRRKEIFRTCLNADAGSLRRYLHCGREMQHAESERSLSPLRNEFTLAVKERWEDIYNSTREIAR